MNSIKVYGIRTFSYHGCLPEETKIGGNYIVDVDLWCDFSASALTDDLSKTIDYCDVNSVVVDQMATPCKLIETVAYRIVNQLKKELHQLEKVRVEIKKINPPIDGDVNFVSVVVEE
jgi:dihydroneopterin aldolase